MYTATMKVEVNFKREPTDAEKRSAPDVKEYDETVPVEITLRSDKRNYLRNLELLCKENKIPCLTVVEVAPRAVKFKGVE